MTRHLRSHGATPSTSTDAPRLDGPPRWIGFLLWGGFLLGGCSSPPEARTTPTASSPAPALRLRSVEPAPTATHLELGCGDSEPCNGLDGDCDGQVDEGCSTPGRWINATWNSNAAVVLHYGHASGGEPQVSSESSCEGARRVHLDRPTRPGSYLLTARLAEACAGSESSADPTKGEAGEAGEPTTISIGIADPAAKGALNVTLPADGTSVAIATLDLD